MGKIHMSGASGGVMSDDVTASKYDVIQGKKTVTTDSNDEVVYGTFPEHDFNVSDKGTRLSGSVYMVAIPEGAYRRPIFSTEIPGVADNAGGIVLVSVEDLRKDIGATNSAKWRKDTTIAGLTGTMPEQGGSTTVPGTANKTIVAANRFVTGNIIVSGDADLKAANIKKGVTIFGVKGTFEGFVPVATDLYYKGTNPAGLASDDVDFQNTRINFKYSFAYIKFTKNHDVRSFSKLNLKGDIGWTKDALKIYLRDAPNNNPIISYEKYDGWTNCALDISQLTTIPSGWELFFQNIYTGTERNHYIDHIWFS